MERVCSAALMEFPPGVFITTTPRRRGGLQVDVVHADAGAADDAEPAVCGGDHVWRHLGRRADCKPVEFADDADELLLVRPELRIELNVDPWLRKMLTAVSDRASEMRTRGVMGRDLRMAPRQRYFDLARCGGNGRQTDRTLDRRREKTLP